jgi:hypothetical protein
MDIPDILCLNCENMIEYLQIETHSQTCFKYSAEVQQFDNVGFLSHINFRIIKLKGRLEAILYCSQPTPWYSSLSFLLKKANEILSIQSYTMASIEKSTAILAQIRMNSEKIPIKYSIYNERLKLLASNKVYHILDIVSKQSERTSITKTLLTRKFRIHSERKSLEPIHLRGISDNRLHSIESSEDLTGFHEPRLSIQSSIYSPVGFNCPNEFEDSEKVEKEIFTEESLKKLFYSKCLIVKLSFNSRHPAQYIQINELYEKAVRGDVPVNNWENFIKDEFGHPERWVNLNVIPKVKEYNF